MMIRAASYARVDCWPQRGLVSLAGRFVVETDQGRSLHLPTGMRSDGASVPNALWGVLEATPIELLVPGIAHDGAYRIDARWTLPNGSQSAIRRSDADDLLRALVLWVGASDLDAAKVRWGVGVGAAGAWHQRTLDWRPA